MSGATESMSRKIAGAQDLEGVVRSMKALAASSIGQYEKAVLSLDEYYRTVELGLVACFRQAGSIAVMQNKRPLHGGKIGAVVFGSDQGLVGRFNEVLAEFAVNTLKVLPGKLSKIWAVGERAHELMADTGLSPADLLSVPTSIQAITPLVGQILIEIAGKLLLPLDHTWQNKLAAIPWPTKMLPEVIEGASSAIQVFIREYLFVLLFQACAESLASENGSRLAAMQRAEKNIEDILEDLNRTLHRIRQESIDEELFDVISGYDALTKRGRHV